MIKTTRTEAGGHEVEPGNQNGLNNGGVPDIGTGQIELIELSFSDPAETDEAINDMVYIRRHTLSDGSNLLMSPVGFIVLKDLATREVEPKNREGQWLFKHNPNNKVKSKISDKLAKKYKFFPVEMKDGLLICEAGGLIELDSEIGLTTRHIYNAKMRRLGRSVLSEIEPVYVELDARRQAIVDRQTLDFMLEEIINLHKILGTNLTDELTNLGITTINDPKVLKKIIKYLGGQVNSLQAMVDEKTNKPRASKTFSALATLREIEREL